MLNKKEIKKLKVIEARSFPDEYKDFKEEDFKTILAKVVLMAHIDTSKYRDTSGQLFEGFINSGLWLCCSSTKDCIYIINTLHNHITPLLDKTDSHSNDCVYNQSLSKVAHFILRQVIKTIY